MSDSSSDLDLQDEAKPSSIPSTEYRAIKPLPTKSASASPAPEASAQQASTSTSTSISPNAANAAVFNPKSTSSSTSNSMNSMRHALPAKPFFPAASSSSTSNPSTSTSNQTSPPKRSRVDSSLIPQVPKVPKTATEKDATPRLIVVLEQACLETYKISSGSSHSHSGPSNGGGGRGGYGGNSNGRGKKDDGGDKYALLNCDDHQRVLAKMNRDIAEARPDITHQVS